MQIPRLRASGSTGGRSAPAPGRWRMLVPVVCLVAGVGFAASARDSGGTDLRAPGVTSLADTVHRAEDRVRTLDERVRRLQAQVSELTRDAGAGDSAVARAQRRVAPLRLPGGLAAVHGPGVAIVLDDADDAGSTGGADADPGDDRAQDPAGGSPGAQDPVDENQKVVHQSDLQAVVNALWAGGAEAMTIAGQRVIPTSAVRCVGNTLLLNGDVYSPPYRVAAIGPSRTMLDKLADSPGVRLYQEAASYFGLGYTAETLGSMTLPAYEGPLTLTYAKAGR